MFSGFDTDHWPCPASEFRVDSEIGIKILAEVLNDRGVEFGYRLN